MSELEHFQDELDGIDNDSSGISAGLGALGVAYSGVPIAKWLARRTPFVQRAITNKAAYANNILEGYYNAGVTSADKLMLQKNHFFGSNRSEIRDTARFLKQAHADATQELFVHGQGRPLKGVTRHTGGMALRELDMINNTLPRSERIDARSLLKNGNIDEKDVNKVLNLIKKGKIPYGSPGELLETIKLDYMYEKQNVLQKDIGGIGSQSRKLRHERIKTELVKAVSDQPYNESILKESGYSNPQKQIVKNVFQGPHADAAKKWNLLPHDRISISSFTEMGDKRPLSMANKKDSMFKLADFVTRNAKNLHDPKEVFSLVKERAVSFGTSRNLADYTSIIHPQDDYNRAVERFMKSHYVKNNKLYINYSPDFKPSYLLGGVNTDGVFWKKPGRKDKVAFSLLTTDKYDLKGPEEVVGEGGVQRRRHLTIHSQASSPNDKLFKQPGEYVPNRQKFRNALDEGNVTKALKSLKKMSKVTAKRILSEYGSKHWANRHLLKLFKTIITRRV